MRREPGTGTGTGTSSRRRRPTPAAVAAALALLLALGGCAHTVAQPLPSGAEHHRVRTRDGYALALVRYAPKGPIAGPPVLLVHGISANGRNMDFEDALSLPRWLAARGHDAWVLSIRGTGDSDDPDPKAGRAGGHTFDTLWREDLPATIAYVREQTGGAAIDYVGHSMGGMLAYAYLSQGGEGLDRVVTLGSPTRLDHGSSTLTSALSLRSWVPSGGTLPSRELARLSAPVYGLLPDDLMTLLLFNPQNVSAPLWRRFMVTGVDDVSTPLLLQLSQMVDRGWFGSADGALDFRAGLAQVRNPVLVVAGKLDRFGTPMAAWDAYRALGGEKRWLMLARTHGTQADYGHMDYLLGVRAPVELWPQLQDFLTRR